MPKSLDLLHFSDNDSSREALEKMLNSQGITCDIAGIYSREKLIYLLEQVRFDLLLCGIPNTSLSPEEFLSIVLDKSPATPVIFISYAPNEAVEVELLRSGASDIIQSSQIEKLTISVNRVLLEIEKKKRLQATELAFQDSQNKFLNLINTIPDIVYRLDADGKITFVNDTVKKLGFEPAELIGQHFHTLIFDEDKPRVTRNLVLPNYANKVTGPDDAPKLFDERRAGSRITRNLRLRIRRKDELNQLPESEKSNSFEVYATGEYENQDLNYFTWVEVNSQGQYDTDVFRSTRNFQGTVGIIRDVSEAREYENKTNEQLLGLTILSRAAADYLKCSSPIEVIHFTIRHIADYVPLCIMMHAELKSGGIKLKEVFTNKTSKPGNLKEIKITDIPIDYQSMKTNLDALSPENTFVQVPEVSIPKEILELSGLAGFAFSFYAAAFPVWKSSKAFLFVLSPDIPESRMNVINTLLAQASNAYQNQTATASLREFNKNLKKKIQNSIQDLRNKDQVMIQQSRQAAMGEMIGNIAHQWRQPLNNIGILIQNIQTAQEFNTLDEAYIQKAVDKGMAYIQFMSQTIDDFRNFFKPNRDRCNFRLEESLFSAISLVESSFRSHGIRFDIKMDDDFAVLGYPNEFSQVILNMFTNCKDILKESKTENPLITIRITKKNKHIVLTIHDNGGGIKETDLERLFEPYFTTKKNGTGIGLYMSRMIIEKNMNGKISIKNKGSRSKNNYGAEFTITFPATDKTC